MVEKNPTLGSIETSDFEKRQFAWGSGTFNLRDKVFCELFPELVQEIKEELERRKQERRNAEAQPSVLTDGASSRHQLFRHQLNLNQENGVMGSALANVMVIVGFAAFAYSVKYVLKSLAQ